MKILLTASVLSHIARFHQPLIDMLKEQGHVVHVAAADNLAKRDGLKLQNVDCYYNIAFHRSPFSFANILAYRQLKRIIAENAYDIIHCNTPAVGVYTRMAARGARHRGCKVIYTCHGFHFHNAAPKKYWFLFYPIERLLSRYCDYIITINKEDYNRAKNFHCKNVRYIPGVGVNSAKIDNTRIDKKSIRESIGVAVDKLMLISVGELTWRKNHEVVIRALALLENPNLYYTIAGNGDLWNYLHQLAAKLGVAARVRFLGYRSDVAELYHAADICALPSRIEGLGLSGIEALTAGLPLIAARVHGILDYVQDGQNGYLVAPEDVNGFAEAIRKLAEDSALREHMKPACKQAAAPFDIAYARSALHSIYEEVFSNCKK